MCVGGGAVFGLGVGRRVDKTGRTRSLMDNREPLCCVGQPSWVSCSVYEERMSRKLAVNEGDCGSQFRFSNGSRVSLL